MDFNNEQITNLIITALEGGSNYWCNILISDVSKKEGKSFSERVAFDVLESKNLIPIYDSEADSDDMIGELSLENIKSGIALLKENYGDHYARVFNESYDAETADIFLQLVTLKEIVYG
jgi:hypothetical protein